ncbi:MAG: asparagine synthase (glutamine-hydrolyzing), partial [Candidatus Omnitrophica bacterium]|nr:asparagine synthase (glutamine-hydrolyzing) [Candidatus Omnitrophota bacterium]
GLGSRRLSIIGLGDGRMPMSTCDQKLWVVYNGELYNHPDLQSRLQKKGHVYRTHADTESFLHLYREYGDSFLEQARGMFALALWDAESRRLILGRDRLGVKPLYYQFDGKTLRFGSEIKSILLDPDVPREIDYNALNLYLAYLSAPAPYTMFRGIRQLRPGEMLIFEKGEIRVQSFWKPSERIRPMERFDPQLHPKELLNRLRGVVKQHLLSDVPVGAFLSGGIDSSVLVALMHEELGAGIKTFSIGYKGLGLFDETPHARLASDCFQTDHYEQYLSPNDLLKALEDVTEQLDEPLADSSCLPLYFVSQLAAGQVKVVLSGDGGDEVFAGYRKYQAEYFRRFCSWMPAPALRWIGGAMANRIPESHANLFMDYLRQIKKFFRGFDPDPFSRHLKWAVHFEDSVRKPLLRQEVLDEIDFHLPWTYRHEFFDEMPQLDELNRMLWVDLRHNLPADMLRKVDRMSMLHSLEVRVPFLDHEFVEWGFSLPGEAKLRGKTTKWILKEAFRGVFPDEILDRRKHGFEAPVGEWFRTELRGVIEEICSPHTVNRRGLFDPRQVAQVLLDHQDRRRDYNNQLWMLLSLELWQRRYLDRSAGFHPA